MSAAYVRELTEAEAAQAATGGAMGAADDSGDDGVVTAENGTVRYSLDGAGNENSQYTGFVDIENAVTAAGGTYSYPGVSSAGGAVRPGAPRSAPIEVTAAQLDAFMRGNAGAIAIDGPAAEP